MGTTGFHIHRLAAPTLTTMKCHSALLLCYPWGFNVIHQLRHGGGSFALQLRAMLFFISWFMSPTTLWTLQTSFGEVILLRNFPFYRERKTDSGVCTCVHYYVHSLVQWNRFSDVTRCTWITFISDVREPISLHQAVLGHVNLRWGKMPPITLPTIQTSSWGGDLLVHLNMRCDRCHRQFMHIWVQKVSAFSDMHSQHIGDMMPIVASYIRYVAPRLS